uniref:EF-hand domain-containing protein n=6 Tax=Rhodosorus marinus TaxID=101924 RepID=A0A7S2ZTP8_9RHOD|mmetsp:Transcript_3213/g.15043  ORF Transcript_3213/g.15043 Transcript_3213/m.15043 type:complete len:512 (+) Transcript_3213:934-2469(+)
MKVLAIGFQPRHIGAMAQLLCASGTLEMIVYRESMALSPELLKDYSIALVHPTKEEKLQELRIATKKLPVVVVGNSATYADAASRCLRKGARCFIPEPLTERTAMSIRSLAQQFARTQTNVVMGRSAPQRVQTQEKKKKLVIDFDEMRMKYEGKNGRIKETPRQRLEESALGMLAQRKRGPLQRDDFSPVATLCGLPACAGEVLYDAVVRFDTSDGVDEPNASEIGVSKELLMKFWNERLRHFDTETRLFNILCGPNSNLASEENMKVVMGKLLRSRGSGFSLIRANARDQSLKQLEEIATAIVFFGISGSMQPLRKSQLRKINFCKVLNTVESGVFNGFAASLRPDRFQGVLCALNDAGNKGYMELEDVQLFNAEHRLLVNAAVKRLFKTYCDKNQKMSVGEFTRFYLASMDPTSDAACKYLFPALDADLDGFVSAADLAIMYRSKKYDVEFGVLWSSLLDLIGSSNNSARTDQVSSSNILALAGKDRALLLKTLIYIDDDMEVDIHRSR